LVQIRLSYEEQILNALMHVGGMKKGESNRDYNDRRFNAVREVLQPLYKQVKQLEDELGVRTARQMAVRYAGHLEEKLREIREEEVIDKVSVRHLRWMCGQIIEHTGYVPQEWSVTKLHRWIGYIQGVMVAKGYTTVDKEREDYREMKKELLKELSLEERNI
jgi:hypothetical protein